MFYEDLSFFPVFYGGFYVCFGGFPMFFLPFSGISPWFPGLPGGRRGTAGWPPEEQSSFFVFFWFFFLFLVLGYFGFWFLVFGGFWVILGFFLRFFLV